MRVKLKGIAGLYAIGECGVVDLESYEDLEQAVENKKYTNFCRKRNY